MSQSTPPRPQRAQPQQQGARVRRPTATPNRKPGAKTQTPSEEPPSSSSSSTSSSDHELEEAQESGPSQVPTVAAPLAGLNAQKTTSVQPSAEASSHSNSKETEAIQIESASPSGNENVKTPPVQETVMDEVIRDTGGRLRKTRSAANRESASSPT
ncbi:HVA22-like protein i [Camellia sinensis]|uniref:HVA22-like protein i n=1 Tax=Camellia sinensis TaxID=4442 RepID=UPI001036C750|nr:HVA22-like protein i [Camellia sinensis]